MECIKCKYYPCIREECNLKGGECRYGKRCYEEEVEDEKRSCY